MCLNYFLHAYVYTHIYVCQVNMPPEHANTCSLICNLLIKMQSSHFGTLGNRSAEMGNVSKTCQLNGTHVYICMYLCMLVCKNTFASSRNHAFATSSSSPTKHVFISLQVPTYMSLQQAYTHTSAYIHTQVHLHASSIDTHIHLYKQSPCLHFFAKASSSYFPSSTSTSLPQHARTTSAWAVKSQFAFYSFIAGFLLNFKISFRSEHDMISFNLLFLVDILCATLLVVVVCCCC